MKKLSEAEILLLSGELKAGVAYQGPPLIPQLPGTTTFECVSVASDGTAEFNVVYDGIPVFPALMYVDKGEIQIETWDEGEAAA